MLSNRFINDGKPEIHINQVQRCALYNFQKKLDSGEYTFENYNCECGTPFEQLIVLGEKDRYGLSVETKICPNCGLVMTNPRMTQQSYDKFYDSYYRQIYVGVRHAGDEHFERRRKEGKNIYDYISAVYKFFDFFL